MGGVPIDADPVTTERADKLSSIFRTLAESELQGYCPIYERIARGMADDQQMLGRYANVVKRVGMLPILLFACVHDLVLTESEVGDRDRDRENDRDRDSGDAALAELARIYAGGDGDPWPAFRRVLETHADTVSSLMRERAVQTNEVGRTAAVLPALTAVARRLGEPLALIELGPSAGLNLFFDHFVIDYGHGLVSGPDGSPVFLQCERLGDLVPPLPVAPLEIASREGIDLNPLDVTDEVDRRWLAACLWPGLEYRRAQQAHAITIARADPPTLHRGSAIDVLPDVLEGIPTSSVPCVLSTWVLGYFSIEERRDLKVVLDAVGARRPLAFVTGEYPKVVDWMPEPETKPPIQDDRGASLLGITAWEDGVCAATPVAWMQAHGRWLHWLDPETAAAR